MKKVLSIILALMLCIGLAAPVLATEEEEFTIQDGELRKYNGQGGVVTIPGNVWKIEADAFAMCEGLTRVIIHKDVETIEPTAFAWCTGLTEFDVAAENEHYRSIDGVLYYLNVLDGTPETLSVFPGGKTGEYEIPESVCLIENNAFYGCPGLTGLTLSKNLCEVPADAFVTCENLASITVPQENALFASTGGVLFDRHFSELICCPPSRNGEYEIPPGITSLRAGAFKNCTKLTKVTVHSGVTAIPDEAFCYCDSLKEVFLPVSVQNIGARAFGKCQKLTDVYYAGTDTQWAAIAKGTQNTELSGVSVHCNSAEPNVPNPEPAGGGGAPGGGGESGGGGATNENEWTYQLDNQNAIITGYTGAGGTVIIPCTLDGYSVTEIGNNALSQCSGLISIVIPEGVTKIGYNAFFRCEALESVYLPDSLQQIGSQAFYGTALTSVTIPKSVTSIDGHAFSTCMDLTCFSVDSGNTAYQSIDGVLYTTSPLTLAAYPYGKSGDSYEVVSGTTAIHGTLANHYSLKSITIPVSVTEIGDAVFSGNESLSDIYFGGTITQWGAVRKGNNNDSLVNVTMHYGSDSPGPSGGGGSSGGGGGEGTSEADWLYDEYIDMAFITGYIGVGGAVTVPSTLGGKTVTEIGRHAFFNNSTLTSITIPDTVTYIREGAFSGCVNLTCAVIPDSVTGYNGYVFENCSSLKSIEIPEGVSFIPQAAFSGCSALESVVIPNSVTSIDWEAFMGCASLKNIKLPNNVTIINSAAFSGCSSLERITIPQNVQKIWDSAFSGCTSLKSVVLPAGLTAIKYGAFYGCSGLKSVFFEGSKEQWDAITIENNNDPMKHAELHCDIVPEVPVPVQPSAPITGDPWITEATYSGDTLILTADESVSVPVFLAAYNDKGQMVGVYAAECINGDYMLPVGVDAEKYEWKLMFVDEGTFSPLTCSYLLNFTV